MTRADHQFDGFDRVYRAALRIYPRAFRDRYGDEMTQFARARLVAARARGAFATAWEAGRLVTDLIVAAPRVWELRSAPLHHVTTEAPLYPRDNVDIMLQDIRYAARARAPAGLHADRGGDPRPRHRSEYRHLLRRRRRPHPAAAI